MVDINATLKTTIGETAQIKPWFTFEERATFVPPKDVLFELRVVHLVQPCCFEFW